MGHSDFKSLQDQPGTGEATAAPASDVQVWGDMYRFELREPAADADSGAADGGAQPLAREDHRCVSEPRAPQDFYQRIGQLTRTLHDAMRELGHHQNLAHARDELPDARDRLAYVARLTGEAAEKVLNSVDRARLLQEETSRHARSLQTRWADVDAHCTEGGRPTLAGAALLEETRTFLATLGDQAELTNAILTDIMMAQDFHDLTGQVIRKIVLLAQTLEEQLVKLLVDANQDGTRKKADADRLEGPVVGAHARADVVADQAGVDALLASLGF